MYKTFTEELFVVALVHFMMCQSISAEKVPTLFGGKPILLISE